MELFGRVCLVGGAEVVSVSAVLLVADLVAARAISDMWYTHLEAQRCLCMAGPGCIKLATYLARVTGPNVHLTYSSI
jgi:hypothetical protein